MAMSSLFAGRLAARNGGGRGGRAAGRLGGCVAGVVSEAQSHGQNAFPGTPAQGLGMVDSWGSGIITVRVCFGYLA
jgi:hypothetical protein